jgi:tetratricopeptide (TPR) repeat protein
VLVLVLVALVRKSAAHLRGQADREAFLLLAGLLSGVAAAACAGCVGNPFLQPAVLGLAFLFLGLSERIGNPAPQTGTVRAAGTVRRLFLPLVVLMSLGLARGAGSAVLDAMAARFLACQRMAGRVEDGPDRARLSVDAVAWRSILEGGLSVTWIFWDRWDLHRAIGWSHLWDGPGGLALAAAHLARARDLNPNDPETWNAWGLLNRMGGRRDEGRGAFERAVRLDPVVRDPRMNLALACEQDGMPGPAIAQYDALLIQDPKDAAVHFGRGHVLAQSGNFAGAADAFTAAARNGYRIRGNDARAEVLRMDSLRPFRESEAGRAWLQRAP